MLFGWETGLVWRVLGSAVCAFGRTPQTIEQTSSRLAIRLSLRNQALSAVSQHHWQEYDDRLLILNRS